MLGLALYSLQSSILIPNEVNVKIKIKFNYVNIILVSLLTNTIYVCINELVGKLLPISFEIGLLLRTMTYLH